MENLQVINHPQFGQLSVVIVDGKEMFKAKDVAIMLGYEDTINAVKQHCKGVVKHHLPTKGGKQTVNLIPEGDVWRLIIRSKLPQAEIIEKWIMEEVLPSIRKNGTYSMKRNNIPEQLTLETAEYHYYDKTYNGQPVISLVDFVHLTGVPKHRAYGILMRLGSDGKHYFRLDGASLAAFKQQNPSFPKAAVRWFIVVTKAGFELLMKEFGSKADVPQCFIEENSEYVPGYSMQELMGFLERDIATVDELRQRMLEPSTKSEAERNRNKLVIALKRLKWWYFDTSTIRI